MGTPSQRTGGSRTFSYDVRNRLRQAVANSQTVATYTINALGQRVRKVAGSSDVDFVYDRSGKLIGEYTNGAQIREYVYLDNLPVAQIAANGAITYLHPDHLGTPRSATNANAQIVWRWDSDPFGKATPNQDPDGDSTNVTVNLRFPGQYFDMETGLSYNYFRDYDAGVGRYVQSDPIGLAGGLNTFAYAGNNSTRFFDPLGLAIPDSLVATCGGLGCRIVNTPTVPSNLMRRPGLPWNGNLLPASLLPGHGYQDFVCTSPASALNQYPSAKTCCVIHDLCYENNECNVTSWATNPFVEESCNRCNSEAVQCVENAVRYWPYSDLGCQ